MSLESSSSGDADDKHDDSPTRRSPSVTSHPAYQDSLDEIERTITQKTVHLDYSEEKGKEAGLSLDLRRTVTRATTVLDRVFTTRSIVDPPPPPDGGLAAWTQVACAWLVVICSWGMNNAFGVFQTYYTLNLDESASTISWIGTIQNWLTFILGALSGRALDAGFYRPVLIVGIVIQLLGIFLMSVSTKYWQLLLTQGLLCGIGNGLFFPPSMGLVATYFSSHRALAIGFATTGNSMGGMIYPIIVRQLLPKVGFAWTARTLGFLNLGLLSIVVAFMKPRLPPRKAGPLIDMRGFREAPYSLYVACLFFGYWGVYFTFYYLGSYGLSALSLPYTSSTNLIILLNGIGTPTRILLPYLADRVGPITVLWPTLLALVIVSYSWLAVSSVPGIYIFTVFYGLLNAGFQALIPSGVASMTPDLNMVGTRLGMAFSAYSFAALTGPPIGGALLQVGGGAKENYLGAQIWAASAMAAAAGFCLTARWAKAGWRWGEKC